MLKSVLLFIFLWHEMCGFSSRAQPISTDTAIPNLRTSVLWKINNTDVQIDPKGNYNNITLFYVNGPLFGSAESTPPSLTVSPTASPTTSPTASAKASPTAPSGYIVTNGIGAHKLYTDEVTWTRARQICIEDGGDLAVIRSDAEEEITKKIATDAGIKKPWIGFHAQPGKRHWVCIVKETLNDNESGEWLSWVGYDAHRQGADYHVYDYDGTLGMTTACYTTRPFICKITTI